MSDETTPNPPTESEPRARKKASPRPKKQPKVSAKKASHSEPVTAEVEIAPVIKPEPPVIPAPAPQPALAEQNAPTLTSWAEPEPASFGGPSQSENSKRKRRRKKGKGGNNSSHHSAFISHAEPESSGPINEITEPLVPQNPAQGTTHSPSQHPRPPQQPQAPRSKADPELLAKFAWKIYLSEVSEEGVSLIGDNDAKELSRRCFRLAEIFLDEQSRRR